MRFRKAAAVLAAIALMGTTCAVPAFALEQTTVEMVTIQCKGDNIIKWDTGILGGKAIETVTIKAIIPDGGGWRGGGGAVGYNTVDESIKDGDDAGWAQIDFDSNSGALVIDDQGNAEVTLDFKSKYEGKDLSPKEGGGVVMLGWWWASGDSAQLVDVIINGESIIGKTAEFRTEAEEEPAAEEEAPTAAEDNDKADANTDEEEIIETDDTDALEIVARTDFEPDDVNDNGYFRILSGADSGEASLFIGMTDEILDVYGVRYKVDFDDAEVADDAVWIGGGIGANSESTGWEAHEWGKASGEKEITPDFENGIIEWMDTEPIFSEDDTYAHLWMQTWGGNVTILQIEVLDADGDVLWSTTPVEVEKEETPVLIAPAPEETVEEAPAAGDVAAAAETSKGSPDTGVADVAAVAGLAVAAAGAFVIAKKRK